MFTWLSQHEWKHGIALVILWANAYQLIAWPLLFWATTIITAVSGFQIPGPPIVPWEQLFVGTATLATVGGIQTWRDSHPRKRKQTTILSRETNDANQ
jgi:hypothetical protein